MLPDPLLAVAAVLCLAAVELAKTLRWQALFGALRPPFAVCLRALVAGQIANALLPIRGGEVVRVGIVALERGSPVAATAALALAKVVDALCLAAIALAVLGAAVLGELGWRVAIPAALLAIAVAVALRAEPLRVRLDRLPLARRFRLRDAVAAAQALREPRTLAIVVSTTAVVWTAGCAANAVVLAAVGIPPTLDLAARVLVAAYLVGLLPAPPGRLVVYEAGVSAALLSGGVEPSAALAASVTLHACQFVELGGLLAASLLLTRLGRSSAPA